MKITTEHLETSIYIIDADYHIVHFNSRLHLAFPGLKAGDLCYKALCNENAPCENCPLSAKYKNRAIFYNKHIQDWVEINTGIIDMPQTGECYLLLARRIHEGNKNLFYSLTDLSSYDELYELNLTQNLYRILYHLPEKFVSPPPSGTLTTMAQDVALHMIHPEDQEAFCRFCDQQDIVARLTNPPCPNALTGQFRKLKPDGSYGWTLQTVVPIKYSENNDQIFMCFIQDIQDQKMEELKNQDTDLLASASIDPLTGLYRRNAFFNHAQEFLAAADDTAYCMMLIDIEHFKLFNEWYGTQAGDSFLINIAGHLQKAQEEYGGIAGYIGNDDFAIILPYSAPLFADLQQQITGYVKQYEGTAGFLPAFGMYLIEDRSLLVSTMYDRASMALATVKGNYAQRVSWYDARIMAQMEKNHMLLSEVQRALDNREFTFYAQPKCNMATGKIIGLESLVRWIHPDRGLIPPGEFIPLLENNGFISKLDFYIWDMVCSSVRRWIDTGHRAIPISVNVSRVDIYALNVPGTFRSLIRKYGLAPELIEIEITESAYTQEPHRITGVVESLRKSGFTVLMDDFGSGYSSLNMLKDVNMDIIKLDMKFLDMDEQTAGKGLGILEAVTNMARFMGLRLIAEGIETKAQLDLLLNMGCLYGQGYYFYRPMPIETFEPLLADEANIDFRGICAEQVDRIHIRDLMNDNLFSETLINNVLGAIAFYSVCGGRLTLVRANEQYYQVTQSNSVDLAEQRKEILNVVYEGDRPCALDIFSRARNNILNGAVGEIRRLTGNGSTIWISLHVFFLREQDGQQLFYGSLCDITKQKRKEQQLESSQRSLSSVVHIAEGNTSFMKLAEENRKTASAIFAQITPGGMIGGYCEDGYPLYFANYEMVRLLGYDNYEEFEEKIDRKVIHTIHPDDRKRIAGDIGNDYYPGLEYTTTYRMIRKDGTWFWTLDKGKVVQSEDGRLAIVSACTDISEPMRVQQQLTEQNSLLLRRNQELQFMNSYIPGAYHRCLSEEGFPFLYASGRFLEIIGYTRQELVSLFDNKFMNLVHPEDRQLVANGVRYLKSHDELYNLEYRILTKNGYIHILDQSQFLEYDDTEFVQGVILDITALRENERHLVSANRKLDRVLELAGMNPYLWDVPGHRLKLPEASFRKRIAEAFPSFHWDRDCIEAFPECVLSQESIPYENRTQFQALLEIIYARPAEEPFSFEFKLHFPEGNTLLLKNIYETIRGISGEPLEVRGFYMIKSGSPAE